VRDLPAREQQLPTGRVQLVRIRHRYAALLLSRNITLFTFDFAGCGLSEGEYISLGFYERQDVECVFTFLRTLGTVSSIGIWGRSMGAVTALMYADSNHEIGCLVLDSPFSNL
jgi:alpha/beta superfamily hydrolase